MRDQVLTRSCPCPCHGRRRPPGVAAGIGASRIVAPRIAAPRIAALGIAAAVLLPPGLAAQADATSRSWNQPVAPYRIAGNLYYVGANEITSFLVATRSGLIVLDGGFVETAPQIRDNVARLGFALREVKILLNSHAHYDHAGGLAQLKAWTGARLLASAADAPRLAQGGRGDPVLGDSLPFPAVETDRIVRDGEAVTLGGTTLVAHITPGHTPGCTTWTMQVTEGGRQLDVVFVCSTSVLPGHRLVDRPSWPGVAEDYARTFAALKALPCDIFLASHASFYGGLDKGQRLRAGASPNPFFDPQGYRTYLARAEAAFRDRLAAERTHPAASPRR
jgi:metallo-beta-lactamase class B